MKKREDIKIDEQKDSDHLSRRDVVKGALTAGVFVEVGDSAIGSAVATGETKTGFLRMSDFSSGYGIGTVVTTTDVVDDVVLKQPGRTGAIKKANVLQRQKYQRIVEKNEEIEQEETVEKASAQNSWTPGAEFWSLDGPSEINSRMKITDAEGYSSEATFELLGRDKPIVSTTEPVMKVTLKVIK